MDVEPIPLHRRAFWDRFFWQAAVAPSGTEAETILAATDLHAIAGDDLYAALVTWAADPHATLDMRATYDALFPRSCFCRRHSPMDCDDPDFSGRNIHRLLYYIDKCVANSSDILFRRTPDIDLLRCRECGDIWLRGMDLDWLRSHYLLLEPGDLEAIRSEGRWPDGLDRFEDNWIATEGGMRRDDPGLPAWQKEANTPEALQSFGRQR
jgi:hypothetical protein